MSDQFEAYETQEADDQLSIAIKMIVSAFENQNRSLNTEIGRLAEELTKSNNRIFELEAKCARLSQDKEKNESQLTSLLYQNDELTDKLQELTIENTKLKSIKNTIIATIEKTDIKDKAMIQEGSSEENSPSAIQPTIKFCKPHIALTRNNKQYHSIDNILEDIEPNKAQLNKNKSFVYTPCQGTSNSRNYLNKQTSNVPGRRSNNTSSTSKANSYIGKSEATSEHLMKNGQNSNFFKNCRKTIDQPEYTEMIEIVRAFNTKKLSKQDTFMKMTQILELKYPELFEEFKMLFFPHE